MSDNWIMDGSFVRADYYVESPARGGSPDVTVRKVDGRYIQVFLVGYVADGENYGHCEGAQAPSQEETCMSRETRRDNRSNRAGKSARRRANRKARRK